MTDKRAKPMGLHARLARVEQETGGENGPAVIMLTDDYGHKEYPNGKPRPGGRVLEIHLGGVDIDKDF